MKGPKCVVCGQPTDRDRDIPVGPRVVVHSECWDRALDLAAILANHPSSPTAARFVDRVLDVELGVGWDAELGARLCGS